ncbi:HMG high mobility group box-containing protein [Nitzschia inconspicua]|uniref:HMG high mobility group box-containing protein n=1 Tax=Nitzschia inconspicua TaxID=303405 RepID=A0A9K3LD76_9STRA|nr:HMG high mobility group box-containing protein [Nitzschia inconspicua]
MDGINKDGKRHEKTFPADTAAGGKVPRKKGRKVKPKGFPKRPLSAYNWFFKEERKKVLNLDFQSMGREISSRWRNTTPEQRKQFEELAKFDTERYKKEVQIYEEEQILKAKKERELAERKHMSEEKGSIEGGDGFKKAHSTGFEHPGLFDNSAASLLAAATFGDIEEKSLRDSSRRMTQRFASIPASLEPSVTDIDMARRRQLNQLLLANGIRSMQYQASRNQAPLGTMVHSQTNFFSEQANNTMLLEQPPLGTIAHPQINFFSEQANKTILLEQLPLGTMAHFQTSFLSEQANNMMLLEQLRQREDVALGTRLSQQRGYNGFNVGSTHSQLNDMMLLLQQQQTASNAHPGVSNFSHVANIERTERERFHPVHSSPTITHLRTALHHSLPPSSHRPRDQNEYTVTNESGSNRRRIAPPKSEDS